MKTYVTLVLIGDDGTILFLKALLLESYFHRLSVAKGGVCFAESLIVLAGGMIFLAVHL
jgi:hypothetical protein